MNLALINILMAAAEEEGPHRDDNGQVVTHHWLWPESAELIYGTIASLIIFYLLWRLAGPAAKKAFTDRTERIREEIDSAAQELEDANADAERIRTAKGDIDAERARLFGEADVEAEALLTDGRARLDNEVADLEARAAAEVEAGAGRATDELRAEIGRLAQVTTDGVVADSLDSATEQDLIEGFIARVGATS